MSPKTKGRIGQAVGVAVLLFIGISFYNYVTTETSPTARSIYDFSSVEVTEVNVRRALNSAETRYTGFEFNSDNVYNVSIGSKGTSVTVRLEGGSGTRDAETFARKATYAFLDASKKLFTNSAVLTVTLVTHNVRGDVIDISWNREDFDKVNANSLYNSYAAAFRASRTYSIAPKVFAELPVTSIPEKK